MRVRLIGASRSWFALRPAATLTTTFCGSCQFAAQIILANSAPGNSIRRENQSTEDAAFRNCRASLRRADQSPALQANGSTILQLSRLPHLFAADSGRINVTPVTSAHAVFTLLIETSQPFDHRVDDSRPRAPRPLARGRTLVPTSLISGTAIGWRERQAHGSDLVASAIFSAAEFHRNQPSWRILG